MKYKHEKLLLYIIPFLLGNYGCFTVRNTEQFTYLKVEPSVYDSLLSNVENYYLIDVRTNKEYEKGHIGNAVNYSYLDFHFRKDVKDLDHNKIVFLYCQTCHRSPLAARKLKRMGFSKVYDLKGGYQKWNPVN